MPKLSGDRAVNGGGMMATPFTITHEQNHDYGVDSQYSTIQYKTTVMCGLTLIFHFTDL